MMMIEGKTMTALSIFDHDDGCSEIDRRTTTTTTTTTTTATAIRRATTQTTIGTASSLLLMPMLMLLLATTATYHQAHAQVTNQIVTASIPIDSSATEGSFSGTAMAMSGNVLAVGSPQYDQYTYQYSTSGTYYGNGFVTLYTCTLTDCVFQSRITSPAGWTKARFGAAVALANDGQYLVIGAPGYSSNYGAYAIYDCSTITACVSLTSFKGTSSGAFVGTAVAASMYNSQLWAVIGGPRYKIISPYGSLFYCTCGSSCTCYNNYMGASDPYTQGTAVAVSGNLIVVCDNGLGSWTSGGSVTSYMYPWDCSKGKCSQKGSVSFRAGTGWCNSMSMSGNLVAVGAPFVSSNKGAVYIYTCTTSACTSVTNFAMADSTTGGKLGTFLALNGNYLAVSAPSQNKGEYYVVDLADPASPKPVITESSYLGMTTSSEFGLGIAISDSMIAVGAPASGSPMNIGTGFAAGCPSAGITMPYCLVTPTASATASATQSYTQSATPSATASATQSATASFTESATASFTESATASATQSYTQSATPSATPSATQSATASFTQSETASFTQSETVSFTQSETASFTQSATQSYTRSATASYTMSATASYTRSTTQSATDSATQSPTASFTESATASFSASPTASSTQSATPSAVFSATASFLESATASATPSSTASSTAAVSESATAAYTEFATKTITSISVTESATESATEYLTATTTVFATATATAIPNPPTQPPNTASPTQPAVFCEATSIQNISFARTQSPANATGTCPPDHIGSPSAQCLSSGQFGPIYGVCLPSLPIPTAGPGCTDPVAVTLGAARITTNALSAPVTLYAVTTVDPCFVGSGVWQYAWSISPNVQAVSDALATTIGSSASIDPSRLPPGTYQIGVVVTVPPSSPSSSVSAQNASATVQLQETALPVVIVLDPNTLSLPVAINSLFALNATGSYNPNADADNNISNFVCSWVCVSDLCPTYATASNSTCFVQMLLSGSVGDQAVLMLTVSTADTSAPSTTTNITVEVVASVTASVEVTPDSMSPSHVVSYQRPLRLTSSYSVVPGAEVSQVVWSCVQAVGATCPDLSSILRAPAGDALVIRERSLTPGASYTFRLTITTTSSSGPGAGFGEVTVNINRPPVDGVVALSSSAGTIGQAVPMVLTSGDWVDPEHSPLTYNFVIRPSPSTDVAGTFLFIGSQSINFLYTSELLYGALYVSSVAYDDTGDWSESPPVLVTMGESDASVSALQTRYQTSYAGLGLGDVTRGLLLIGSTATILNSATALSGSHADRVALRSVLVHDFVAALSRLPAPVTGTVATFIQILQYVTAVPSELSQASLEQLLVVAQQYAPLSGDAAPQFLSVINDVTMAIASAGSGARRAPGTFATQQNQTATAMRSLEALAQTLLADNVCDEEATTISSASIQLVARVVSTAQGTTLISSAGDVTTTFGPAFPDLGACVQTIGVAQFGNTYSYAGYSTALLAGDVISLSVGGPTWTLAVFDVSQPTEPVVLSGPQSGYAVSVDTGSLMATSDTIQCVAFNETAQAWDNTMCTKSTSGTMSHLLVCQCNQLPLSVAAGLVSFVVVPATILPSTMVPTNGPTGATGSTDQSDNRGLIIGVVVGVVGGVTLVVVVIIIILVALRSRRQKPATNDDTASISSSRFGTIVTSTFNAPRFSNRNSLDADRHMNELVQMEPSVNDLEKSATPHIGQEH